MKKINKLIILITLSGMIIFVSIVFFNFFLISSKESSNKINKKIEIIPKEISIEESTSGESLAKELAETTSEDPSEEPLQLIPEEKWGDRIRFAILKALGK